MTSKSGRIKHLKYDWMWENREYSKIRLQNAGKKMISTKYWKCGKIKINFKNNCKMRVNKKSETWLQNAENRK